MINYIHIIITLLAGIIYTITAIVLGISTITWGLNLIIVIILFFVVGSFFKRYLIKNIFNDKMIEEETFSGGNVEKVEENDAKDEVININDDELKENENFFESLGDE